MEPLPDDQQFFACQFCHTVFTDEQAAMECEESCENDAADPANETPAYAVDDGDIDDDSGIRKV